MLSQTVEYALRAVTHLASEAPDTTTTSDLSKATQVPVAYLSKVLQSLIRAGFVRSQRGSGGGVALAVSIDDLTMLDVVNAVDPLERIPTCPLKISSHGTNLCPLHRKMDDAIATVEACFAGATLAKVLSERSQSRPLCDSNQAKAQ